MNIVRVGQPSGWRLAVFLSVMVAAFSGLLVWSWKAFVLAILLAAAVGPTDRVSNTLHGWLQG